MFLPLGFLILVVPGFAGHPESGAGFLGSCPPRSAHGVGLMFLFHGLGSSSFHYEHPCPLFWRDAASAGVAGLLGSWDRSEKGEIEWSLSQ
jgi:hypothetical protein